MTRASAGHILITYGANLNYFVQQFNSCNYNFHMTFAVSWEFMKCSDSQAVDTESSQAPGLTHRFLGFMNVHRGTGVSVAVTVHRFVFLVFYIRCISKYNINCIQNAFTRYIKITTKYKKIETNKILCFINISLHYISLWTGEYGWPSYSQLIIFTSSKIIFTSSKNIFTVVKIFLLVVEIKHWPKLLTIKYFYWW